MSYSVRTIAYFDKQFKKLAKRYPSLKSDLTQLLREVKEKPDTGISLGNQCYKIRLAISSKNKGKSGGARLITYVAFYEDTVYLLSIYDKSDQADIDNNELLRLIRLANQ